MNNIQKPTKDYLDVLEEVVDISNSTDPCWKGYKQIGMKDKNGKQVPNCVPESNESKASESRKVKGSESYIPCDNCHGSGKILIDEYQGHGVYDPCGSCNGTGNSSLTVEEITQYIDEKYDDGDFDDLLRDVHIRFSHIIDDIADKTKEYILYDNKNIFRNTYRESKTSEGFYQGLHGYVDAKCKTCGGLEFGSIEDMNDHYAMNPDHESNLNDLDNNIPNIN